MYLRMGTIAIICVTVAACGGGGALFRTASQLDYTNAADARHSYSPYTTGSHAYSWDPGTVGNDVQEIYIGGDLEPRENLRHVLTHNGIDYYVGASRDGVGVDRLENYKLDLETRNGTDPFNFMGDGFRPFITQPLLYLDADLLAPGNAGILWALADSILILNDSLPPEYQIRVMGSREGNIAYRGEIQVNLEPAATVGLRCGVNAVACASNTPLALWSPFSASSTLYLPNDFDTSEYTYPRKVIVHELLHALGIQGHVDSIEFPDSIMGTTGEYIPNLGHIISKIDREVLQIMYMS